MAAILSFTVTPESVLCGAFVRIRVTADFVSSGSIVVEIPPSFPCVFIWNGMRTQVLHEPVMNADQESVEFRCRMECNGTFAIPLRATASDSAGAHSSFRQAFVRC